MLEGLEDGGFGDLIEDDPLDVNAGQHVGRLQHLAHVPRNGLALAVRIGGQIQVIGTFDRLGDFLQVLFGPGVDFPIHFEVGLRAHRSVLGRQVADVAIGGVDGLGLGWALDDDDVGHGSPLGFF